MNRIHVSAVFAGFAAAVTLAFAPGAEPEPKWWRGNLHTHTLWSDGDDFPEMVVEWYRNHGYQFLALSDHNLLSQGQMWKQVAEVNRKAKTDAYTRYRGHFGANWVETRNGPDPERLEVRLKPFDEYRTLVEERNRFLMIQSEEITHKAGNGRSFHLNATNLGEALTPLDGATVPEAMARNLAAVRESAERTGRDVLVHLNHPNYKWGVTAEDLAAVPEERFFEVWNGVDDDHDPGDATHPSTDQMWDIANTLRMVGHNEPPLFGVATDDSHNYHGNNQRAIPGRAWVMVRSRYLTAQAIVRALRSGDFYASSGVMLRDVVYDRSTRTLSLDVQAQAGETFVTRFIGTRKGANMQGKPRSGADAGTTLDYGPQVGQVLAEITGAHASYTLRGEELYVRAIVTSSATPEVPSTEFPYKRAWTQPVGW